MRPIPERQGELFPRPLDEAPDLAGLTREHLRSWHQKGWLSFDDSQAENLDNPHFCEIVFIRNLVWDLKEDSLVNLFLKGLGKPYRYDPARTAFSFSYGWVQTPDLPDVESDLDERPRVYRQVLGLVDFIQVSDRRKEDDPGICSQDAPG